MPRSAQIVAAVVTVALAVAVPAGAAQNAATCATRKNACVARRLATSLACISKATRKALPVDGACLATAEARFAGGPGVRLACFPGVEARGGCVAGRDASTIAATVDDFLAEAVAELEAGATGVAAGKCSAAKEGCVSKLALALLRCHAKAQRKGTIVDESCLAKARAAFDGGAKPERACFTRVEARRACAGADPIPDDALAMETRVDAFVDTVVCGLLPSDPGCVEPTPAATGNTPSTPAGPTPTVTGVTPTIAGGTPHATATAASTAIVRTPTPTRTPTPIRSATPTRSGGPTPTPKRTPPPAVCGNGVLEDGEDCDGVNVEGFTCDDFCIGSGGTLGCTSECFFDLSHCTGFGCEEP